MGVADVVAAGVATGASAADVLSVGATCATGVTATLSGAGASVIGATEGSVGSVALGAVGAGGRAIGPSTSASLFCNSRARACHASARPRCLSAYDTQSRIAPS